jgi:hypothetical protein
VHNTVLCISDFSLEVIHETMMHRARECASCCVSSRKAVVCLIIHFIPAYKSARQEHISFIFLEVLIELVLLVKLMTDEAAVILGWESISDPIVAI